MAECGAIHLKSTEIFPVAGANGVGWCIVFNKTPTEKDVERLR